MKNAILALIIVLAFTVQGQNKSKDSLKVDAQMSKAQLAAAKSVSDLIPALPKNDKELRVAMVGKAKGIMEIVSFKGSDLDKAALNILSNVDVNTKLHFDWRTGDSKQTGHWAILVEK